MNWTSSIILRLATAAVVLLVVGVPGSGVALGAGEPGHGAHGRDRVDRSARPDAAGFGSREMIDEMETIALGDLGCDFEWSALGAGVNNFIRAVAVFDDGSGPALYAGGDFTQAGGNPANRIARWDGAAWTTVGSGMNDSVYTLTVFDDGSGPALYAGGDFTQAGGNPANRIARWDGAAWTALGSGMNESVRAMTVFDDGNGPALHAGGLFTQAGGSTASRIARWDGAAWSSLGSEMDSAVLALTVFDDGSGPALYAGGDFMEIDELLAVRVARWDGTAWSPLGTGMNDFVYSLTVFDDGSGSALYAGGLFFEAGGIAANSIARWNGAAWSPVGSGFNGPVLDMTVFDDGNGPALYAGGQFTLTGGSQTSNTARWDGAAWSLVGTGITNSTIWALTVFDDGSSPALYAGGWFTQAGGSPANRIARWGLSCLVDPVITTQPVPVVLLEAGGGLAQLSVAAEGFGLVYQWYRDGQPLSDFVSPMGSVTGSDTPVLEVFSQGPWMTGVYDCEVTNAFGASVFSGEAVLAARPSCAGDVNFDGVVDTQDLGILLGAFGSLCP